MEVHVLVARCIDMLLPAPASRTTRDVARDGWIVMCAANSWDDVKMQDRHMAEQLVAHGPVLYVDPPVSHLSRINKPAVAASTKRPRLRTVAPNLARLTPIVPPKQSHPAVVRTAGWMARRQLQRAVRELGGPVHAVISTWLFMDVYGVCGEQRRVYWWQDDPVGAARLWGVDGDRLAAAEDRRARASDLVVAVNEGATERLRGRGVRAEFLPNGCDPTFFATVDVAPAPPDVDLPGPIAGFVGHINSRTDLALLEAVADSGISLLVIGPKSPSFEPERFARLTARANVQYLGGRPFEELPSYFKVIDVGLVPYGDTEFNRSSFPMKALECLTAGRPVVATPLPAMSWLNTPFVALADTPESFAAAVLASVEGARDAELVRARREFARNHSWAERAQQLLGLLEQPV
jgi:teichuronic acid biosynthesis glycosyltransferase TuaH